MGQTLGYPKNINFGWIKKKSMKMFNDFRFSKHSFDSFMMDLGIMGDLSRFEPHGLDGWTRPMGHPGFATFHIMCVAKFGWGEGRGAGWVKGPWFRQRQLNDI